MDDKYIKELRNALSVLNSIKSFPDYYVNYLQKHKIENFSDFFDLLDYFKEHLQSNNGLGEEEKIIISHVKSLLEKVRYKNNSSKLFITTNHLKPNEEFINSFLEEYHLVETDNLYFKEIKPRRFKTITEKIVLYGIDGRKLYTLFEKYKGYNHPFIFYLISEPLINAKNYSQGISILEESLKYAFRYPNIYWNSLYGLEGCMWALFNIQFLLKKDGISVIDKKISLFRIKLLKLIYLYLTRYICIHSNDPRIIDCYSNRGRLVKDYSMDFIAIFGLGVNPEIQCLSDYYLGYQSAIKFNLFAPPFMQLRWESMKLYRHGSHIPNSTGGYQDIEDRTWMELVRDGEIRSIHFAKFFLSEFENYDYNLTNDQIKYICNYAKERNKDDFENYTNNLKSKQT
ncbi:hypothetical protein EZS27_016597 [termite gut metagenome]|uniref:Uncharacterized protein n=1 Tax=termite gut metagenome TaxID=433724 RepID=A0A5J4RQD8_9ZZZZ